MTTIVQAAYIVSALLFIMALAGLSKHETAKTGNAYGVTGTLANIHSVEVFLGVFIGAVTLTGSVVAFLKLSTRISSKPLTLPQRHKMNLAALLISAGLMAWFVASGSIVPP